MHRSRDTLKNMKTSECRFRTQKSFHKNVNNQIFNFLFKCNHKALLVIIAKYGQSHYETNGLCCTEPGCGVNEQNSIVK